MRTPALRAPHLAVLGDGPLRDASSGGSGAISVSDDSVAGALMRRYINSIVRRLRSEPGDAANVSTARPGGFRFWI